MMESEFSKDVVRGLKLLGLQDAEVIMTDSSKALETAVEELGASHVLCRKHFFAILNSAAPSLRLVKKITSNLGDVLTRIFSGEKNLDQLIENMLSEFPDEPQHIALERIKKNKNKVCWEITKKVLTFSHNAAINHENNVDKYTEATLKKLKDLIRGDKKFSKEADEMFRKELKLMGACQIVEDLSSRKFIVSDSNMRIKMRHVLEVVEREGVKLQLCTCETWTNLHFPCRHYARYSDRKRIQYMCIDHLPERWRYQEHPLFKQALREMGREVDGPRGCIEFKVRAPPVNTAYIPIKPEAKYSKLLTACKALCKEAKSSNESWKKSYAAGFKMTAALRENPDGDFGDVDEVSEESGIMFESPRKRIKGRKGNGENVALPLGFSQTTFLTDE
eukprot:augustus_masked-scaffold_15-processed-gene-10.59-mRNA-1 protein AED:1.00 eAED:1.00 QI:0/0/0/0/1/1/2/0/390